MDKSLVVREGTWEDDLAKWSDYALYLSRLRLAIEHGQEFAKKFGKFMSPEDKTELAGLNARYDHFYWKYFEKFIKRVRGM